MRIGTPHDIGGLSPQYETYERQKCFLAFAEQAKWSDDLISACREVLSKPEFNLELDYASKHFDPDIPLRWKVLELIANARYGIYDLSYWMDEYGTWQMPRNVFIELGMAIALNRPTLLLRNANNQDLDLPDCLKSMSGHIVEFSGETTLKRALEERLPQWVNIPPDRDWWNRYCILGGRICEYRESHPRSKQWGHKNLSCHISDGHDIDRIDFRNVVEDVLRRFSNVTFDYLDGLPVPKGYDFQMCIYCQAVRSTPFAIYRITPQTPGETFIAIGMSIALEALIEYKISKIFLTEHLQYVPSLLSGYEVDIARNDRERKAHLMRFMPVVIRKVRETVWKPRPLPFIDFLHVEVESLPVSWEPSIDENEAYLATRILDLFNRWGAKARQVSTSSEGSIDLTVESDFGITLAIQVKRSAKPIGVEQVRAFRAQVESLRAAYPVDEFIVVSERGFTQAAKELEEELEVRLFTFSDLVTWITKNWFRSFEEAHHVVIEPGMSGKLGYLTGGNPLLLALSVEMLARDVPFHELVELDLDSLRSLPSKELNRLKRRLESELVSPFQQIKSQLERAVLFLSTVPEGLSSDELAVLLELPPSDANILVNELSQMIYVKRLSSNQLVLHDDMQRLFYEYVWPVIDPNGDLRRNLTQKLNLISPQLKQPETLIGYSDQKEYRSQIFIGRENELGNILDILNQGNDTNVVLITGPGGIGKTFLLHKVEHRLKEKSGFAVGLLDFYNIQYQNISGFQSRIVELLGTEHFQEYSSMQAVYSPLLDNKTHDIEMNRQRSINELFLEGCNQAAHNNRVVLLLDSVESIVGQPLEVYLLDDFAKRVRNFVLILAGRSFQSIHRTDHNLRIFQLSPFSTEEVVEYLRKRVPDA